MHPEAKPCVNCGSMIEPKYLEIAGNVIRLAPAEFCKDDACVLAAEAVRAKEEGIKPSPSNTDGCPELFKNTEPAKLPEVLRNVALHWDPAITKKSLIIHGATRKGKTRCMWYVRNRLKGMKRFVRVLTMFELEAELVSAWGKDRWDRVMRELVECDVLGLDDLGKEKMTDRMASVLFALIDQRTQACRPTIITTNHTGQSLLDRFPDKEIGAAFVARLKDRDLFASVAVAPGAETPEMI